MNKENFFSLSRKYLEEKRIKRMNKYIAHGKVSVLDHSLSVARLAFYLNEKYKFNVNEEDLFKACLFHDFYLYDWHFKKFDGKGFDKYHGYIHPFIAAKNARKYFEINDDVYEAIISHMWPLTFRHYPKNKLAFLLCVADKICAIKETLFRR